MDITRRREGRWIGGVCAGLADRFALSVAAIRLGIVLLAVAAGPPVIVLYLAAWAFLPGDDGGGGAAGRRGERDLFPGAADAAAGAAVVIGAVLVVAQISAWLPRSVLFPALLACAGAAVVWGGRSSGRTVPGSRPLRIALGVSLVLAGGLAMLAAVSDVRTLGRSVAGAAVVIAGLALMLGPWLVRLGRDLADERRQRIRSQERAEVAAHLHDGVLQTLALIQKRASDDRAVRSLALAQERELRSWLYGSGRPEEPATVAGLLRRELDDVEDRYGVRLDAVLVGDAPLDDPARALVGAAREAALNAARHAGVETVHVFLEVEPERISLFVRDKGKGFELAAVPPDRRGVTDSICNRVRRHGGTAHIRSAPGEGAEVELTMPRRAP